MATDNVHDNNDEAEVQPAKKPRLEEATRKVSNLDVFAGSRRRSTRSVQRYGQQDEETTVASEEEEEADDPDFGHLSDSDDDPDFAPTENKKESVSLPDFSFRGRGRARGRGRGRGGRGRFGGTTGKREMRDTCTRGAGRGGGVGRKITSPSTTSQVKRRGRPLIYFKSMTSSSSPSDQTTFDNTTKDTTTTDTSSVHTQQDNNNKGETNGSRGRSALSGAATSFMMSPSKLSSAVNYPTLKRQTQAVRLPEGPQLTPEQLKEIEAQFKTGDFVMAKKDLELDQPPIWRIDGKSLLQKFQAFEKDSKVLYRNISTYSGWTSQGKTLYMPVKTKFIFQSRYDIVVELVDESNSSSGAAADPTALPSEEAAKTTAVISRVPATALSKQPISIPEELNQHMPTFEIFLQTLISQALDNNFLSEIYEENDEYFVDRVKVMEELTAERKQKMRSIVTWVDNFWKSLEVWPSVNVMSSTGKNTCDACYQASCNKLALFYGQPYDDITLKAREEAEKEAPTKNYNVCDQCAKLCELYSTLCHRKYDYFSKCKATVTNIRVSQPSKNTTTILRELLGNDAWITGLFRNMCTTLVRVDRLYEEHQGRTGSGGATAVKPENRAVHVDQS
ncbi:protein of unknown function DUF4211 [Trinorchestia longiramus]|nr:protein of unknown function DUF4211 [Trinorchestia longiramus]